MLRAATLLDGFAVPRTMDSAASSVSDWITLILGRASVLDDSSGPAFGFTLRTGTALASYRISIASLAPLLARSLDWRIWGINMLTVSFPSFARAALFRNGAEDELLDAIASTVGG